MKGKQLYTKKGRYVENAKQIIEDNIGYIESHKDRQQKAVETRAGILHEQQTL